MPERTPAREIFVAPPLTHVRVDGGFWARMLDVNRRVTLPIEYAQCKETGRIDAFKLDWKPGQPNPPHMFWDSDVGKWIEAAADSLAAHPDPALEQLVDEAVNLICSAQQPDGYLNVHFTVVEPEKRWTNLRDCHELYCAGHLAEGAVAYYEATGKRAFLDAMCRYMDYIATVFGTRAGQKRGYCGHEEIELALVKLSRATGEQRYLELAAYFINERGRQPHYFDAEARARGEDPRAFWAHSYAYIQAHLPVREQRDVVGHAVRAMYLYCAMTDVAAATGDRGLWTACTRLWKNLTRKRMHLTGGLGPAQANEGFTAAYDLPNEGAYLETCAAIGLVFWAWRMLAADVDRDYADVMERALYNGTISGVAFDGRSFFYGNPLAAHPGFDGNGKFVSTGYHYRRSKWFGCACCPPNIARLLAQFPSFLYSASARRLAIHQYCQSTARIAVAGQTVKLTQETDYPWNGQIVVTLAPERAAVWTLALRIPGWCRNAALRVNGKTICIASITKKGYAHITREWHAGDRVRLTLPMPVERIEAHPAARHDCGRVALQRGPVVYCLEQVDNGACLHDVLLAATPAFTVKSGRTGILKGVPLISARARRRTAAAWNASLYRPLGSRSRPCRITAIPYFMWANRAPGEMIVWIRQAEQGKTTRSSPSATGAERRKRKMPAPDSA